MKKIYYLIGVLGILFLPIQISAQDLISVYGFGGSGDNRVFKAAIDNQNNIYLIGYFDGTVSAGSNHTAYGTGYDTYVSKYDPNGNLLWFRQIGSTNYDDIPDAVALSADGTSILVAGGFSGPSCDFGDGYTLANTLTGTFDAFLVSLKTSDGTVNLVKSLAYGKGQERAQSMRIDKNSNLVIIGFFQGNSQAAYFSPTDSIVCSGVQNYFILQLNSSFNFNWVKAFTGNSLNNKFYSLDVDNDGYYIAGTNRNALNLDIATLNSNAGTMDMFMYKTDFNGNGQWVRSIKGSGNDVSVYSTCDQRDYIYVSGYFSSTDLKVDSTATTTSVRTVKNEGSNDVFYAKYTTNGTLQWFDTEGSKGDDRLTRLFTNGQYVVIAGQFGDSMTIENQTIVPRGGIDAYGVVHDADDNFVYAIASGGSGTDINQFGLIEDKGRYIFIGQSYSPIDYFSSKDSLINPTPLKRDVYFAKYDKASIRFSVDSISCPGVTNACITALAQGAVFGNVTFLWTKKGDPAFNQTTQKICGLGPGTYYCKMTDELNYQKTDSAILVDPIPLGLSVNSTVNVTCKDSADGKIYITASGGRQPYQYYWTTSGGGGQCASCKDQATLQAGSYTVKVTDFNGCIKTSAPDTIKEPGRLVIQVDDTLWVTAKGAHNGAIYTTASGGTYPYTYKWTPGNGAKDDTTGLAGDNYTLLLTDSKSCTADSTIFINEPGTLNVNYAVGHVSCFGENNGFIHLIITGDYPPFNCLWSKVGDPGFSDTARILNGLTAGIYHVRVRDNDSPYSERNLSIEVRQPSKALNISGIKVDVSCYGLFSGIINLTVTGGTTPYIFSWSKTGDPSFVAHTKDLDSLDAGEYCVTVTDSKGCTSNGCWTISQPAAALSICNATVKNITCPWPSKNDGSICITVCGGTPPYSYHWSNGPTISCINNLSSGEYCVTITDAHGCSLNSCFEIARPSNFAFNPAYHPPLCFGDANGSISLCVTGGNSPYNFAWSNAFNDGPKVCSDNMNLAAGTFSVNITDSKNCKGSHSNMILSQPDSLHIGIANIRDTLCYGSCNGYIQPSITGGTPPYDYSWSNTEITKNVTDLCPGTYTLTVTDANGCIKVASWQIYGLDSLHLDTIPGTHIDNTCSDGSKGQFAVMGSGGSGQFEYQFNGGTWDTANWFRNLATGIDSVGLRDMKYPACVWAGSIPVIITSPPALKFTLDTAINISCFGLINGRRIAIATGGTPGYIYTISPGDSSNLTGTFLNLPAGSYLVKVIDANNCGPYSTANLVITEPSVLAKSSAMADSVSCNGLANGKITVVATGGTEPFYILNPGNISNVSGIFSGLPAGTYIVTVDDANNCGPLSPDSLVIAEPDPIQITSFIKTDAKNAQTPDGTITIVAAGGTGILTYTLNPGGILNTTGQFTGIASGTDTITITDSKGCTMDTIVSIGTGINNPALRKGFYLYPNPFRNAFTLEIDKADHSHYTAEIINVIGAKIYVRNIETSLGSPVKESFDMSSFPPGIYMFKLKNADGTATQRIVKQ